MKRKRVVFVIPFLYPGGAERALILLINNIDRQRFAPDVIVLKEGGALRALINSDVLYHSLGDLTVKNAYFRLGSKLKELKPDIVVTTMVHSNFLLMLLKPFFPKTRFIIREAIVPSFILSKHKNKSFVIKLLYKILYPRAYRVISPSQGIIDEFERIIGIDTKNHIVLYNQVDEEAINRAIVNVYFPQSGVDMLRFVCVGRLVHQKGYDRLINALASFSPSYPWKLVFLGDGEDFEILSELVKKNKLENNIEFLGNVECPWSIIAAADYLLLPSRYEGMPNVILESLASGTPIIVSCEANGAKEIQSNVVQGAVNIASDMQHFVGLMEKTVPANKNIANHSMLTEPFQQKTIVRKFENILSGK
ncbi:MAG: glycosyltransferase [Alphaproteobacteria bacterium]|nr:glycosyltransferase [Alphaproteobacteria bacterium]